MWTGLVVCAVSAMGCGRLAFDDHTAGADAPPLTTPPRSTLRIAAPLTTTLVDFTLPIVLDDTRANRAVMAADGSDLRFYDGAGNLLTHEIAQLGAAGGAPLIAWVRMPSLSAASQILVDYGRPDEPPASTASAWSPEFAAVYHLDEPSGSPRDATTGHHDTVATGTAMVAGMCGAGRGFLGASRDVLAIADAPSLALPAFTLSGWYYETSLPPANVYQALVSREYAASGTNDFWLGDQGGLYFGSFETASDGWLNYTTSAATAATWVHLALTADGTTSRLYVNGVERGAKPMTSPVVHSSRSILIGADANAGVGPDSDFLTGAIDEVRIESVARDASWIQADYLATRDQLLEYGPVGP